MKYIPYGRQIIDEDDIQAVGEVLKSDWITQGSKIKEFEDALCKYTGAKYAVVVSSGTAALHIACIAAGIGNDDEFITSSITFVASANCILYCGGNPLFADIDSKTYNIGVSDIRNTLEVQSSRSQGQRRIKGLIPVHFAGHPCDLSVIEDIAKEHNLLVIEDASHALGAEYKGSKIGSCKYSDMATFSFHPVKPITTGEGGAVLTNSEEYYEKLLALRTHGITKENSKFKIQNSKLVGEWYYEMQALGYNYRLTDIQCALGISQLSKLDKFIQRRREIVQIYKEVFKDNDFFDLPGEKDYAKSSWHLYPIRLKDKYKGKRAEIFKKLREEGLGVQVHYIPVYWQPYYQKLGYKRGICPKAEDFYRREISLPIYQSMSSEDTDYVADKLFEVFRGF